VCSSDLMAAKRGYSLTGYDKVLFEAAYSSNVGFQPNRDMDIAIARAMVMWGAKNDTNTIAKSLGLSQATVIKIIDAWKHEVIAA